MRLEHSAPLTPADTRGDDRTDARGGGTGARGGAPAPAAPPQLDDAAAAADNFSILTHELANLLDASLRSLGVAQRSLTAPPARGPENAHDTRAPDLARRLAVVSTALEQMARLVRAAAYGRLLAAPSPGRWGHSHTWSLRDAVEHAVEVMRPVAEERSIRLSATLDDRLGGIGAGAIYTVVAAGIRNAVEAIERTARTTGTIEVAARIDADRSAPHAVIEIGDDGVGPRQTAPHRLPPAPWGGTVFEHGVTTRRNGRGIGLAVAREAVEEQGGTIRLLARREGGAILRVELPIEKPATPGIPGMSQGTPGMIAAPPGRGANPGIPVS